MFDLLLRRRLGSEKSLRELKRTIFAAKELPIERIQTDTHIYSLRNRKRFPCFYRVIQTAGEKVLTGPFNHSIMSGHSIPFNVTFFFKCAQMKNLHNNPDKTSELCIICLIRR